MRKLIAPLLGFALVLLFPLVVHDQYVLRLAVVSGLFIVVASAHNLLIKVGRLSLGPVAFYSLGAYASSILVTRHHFPFLLAFLFSGIMAGMLGWFVGRLTLRMRGSYFVLVSLGIAEFLRQVALNWTSMTNGPMGITAIPPPAPWFQGYVPYYYGVLAMVVLVLAGLYRIEQSTIGRAMHAIRQNEPLALSVGIDSFRYMMLAATLSSLLMGFAGSYYAHFFRFVGPELLNFDLTVVILVMVVGGGRATLAGPVLGAIVFTILPEYLRATMAWRMVIYGAILMGIMLFMPDGIMPALVGLWRRTSAGLTRLLQRRARLLEALGPGLRPAVATAAAGSASTGGNDNRFIQNEPLAPPSRGAPLTTQEPLLSVRKLCVHFGGLRAVEDVTFDVYPHEILAIIGPNGAGKTTVLNAVTRFGPITSGELLYRGKSLNALRSHEVARLRIVRTFQHTSLFTAVNTTRNLYLGHSAQEAEGLLANILGVGPCRDALCGADKRATEILEFTQMREYASHAASGLPYGYQRLLEIGVALAANPETVMIDEPTAGLNPVEVTAMMRLIENIRQQGITVVLVAHDMRLVMGISDRVLVLNYGQQIALDSPEVVRQDASVISAYLGRRDSRVGTVER